MSPSHGKKYSGRERDSKKNLVNVAWGSLKYGPILTCDGFRSSGRWEEDLL